jgi:hypothetical protein
MKVTKVDNNPYEDHTLLIQDTLNEYNNIKTEKRKSDINYNLNITNSIYAI